MNLSVSESALETPGKSVLADKSALADQRPPLCSNGHVLVVTSSYPPHASGSSVVMNNLLSCFAPSSYAVITECAADHSKGIEGDTGATVHRIMPPLRFSDKANKLWRDIQLPRAAGEIARLAQHYQSKVIVGVYPNFHFLHAAREAARRTGIPLLAYLHDTVAESRAHSRLARRAVILQEQVFKEASRVLVMSEGMADLFKRKYNLPCRALEHTYMEPIPDAPPADMPLRQAFWGGSIYRIHASSVSRITTALKTLDCPMMVSGNVSGDWLKQIGVSDDHINFTFFNKRGAYLEALQQQGILLLALSWPDESPYHEDELATVFPTKTPEYLASGRPILVHCPEHYFLARFFREHGCGTVVSERSVEKLKEAAQAALDNETTVEKQKRAALKTAHLFSSSRIAAIFQEEVEKVSRAS